MGNIRTQPWEEIWQGKHADDVRGAVSRCTDNCWMVCTARSSMIEGAPEVVAWMAYNKLRAHLRTPAPKPPAAPAHANDAPDPRKVVLPVVQVQANAFVGSVVRTDV
jgi:hypothetical protein